MSWRSFLYGSHTQRSEKSIAVALSPIKPIVWQKVPEIASEIRYSIMEWYIPVISLVIAALAVFVGPAISWHIAKRQICASSELATSQIRSLLETSNRQITAPMRQAWINDLRDSLAELCSTALHGNTSGAGFDVSPNTIMLRIRLLESKIQLMLNTAETDHARLEDLIAQMVGAMRRNDKFFEIHAEVIALSKKILKREWDRVKQPITLVE